MAYLAKLGQNGGANRVSEFLGGIRRSITFSAPPRDLAVTRDGELLLVANQAAQGFVSIIDTETWSLIQTVNVGTFPSGNRY